MRRTRITRTYVRSTYVTSHAQAFPAPLASVYDFLDWLTPFDRTMPEKDPLLGTGDSGPKPIWRENKDKRTFVRTTAISAKRL